MCLASDRCERVSRFVAASATIRSTTRLHQRSLTRCDAAVEQASRSASPHLIHRTAHLSSLVDPSPPLCPDSAALNSAALRPLCLQHSLLWASAWESQFLESSGAGEEIEQEVSQPIQRAASLLNISGIVRRQRIAAQKTEAAAGCRLPRFVSPLHSPLSQSA